MSTNNKTLSDAQLHCTNTELKLQFPDNSTNVQSQGAAPSLQGVLAMACSDPKCVSGTTPSIVPFQLDLSVRITQGSGEQPSLLTIVDGKDTPIPVFDSPLAVPCRDDCDSMTGNPADDQSPCGGLCVQLARHRVNLNLRKETRFYVYQVTRAAGELASLSNKLIAVPVSSGSTAN